MGTDVRGRPDTELRLIKAGHVVIWAGVVGGFALVKGPAWEALGEGADRNWAWVVLAAFAAGAGYLTYLSAEDNRSEDEIKSLRTSALAAVAVFLGLGAFGANGTASDTNRTVEAYCAYGARSQAQLDGCKSHVSLSEIERRKTAAARFSRDPINVGCDGEVAGPFCGDIVGDAVERELRPGPYE